MGTLRSLDVHSPLLWLNGLTPKSIQGEFPEQRLDIGIMTFLLLVSVSRAAE
jgi:hypothetical protein